MGNLRRYIQLTFWTFTVGWLAIAGIPPLSGFWAKGDVLDAAWARHPALWVVGLLTALLTAYYMSRLSGLAFFGKDRWNKPPIDPGDPGVHADRPITEPPHEPAWPMRVPLIILAILAFFGGVLSFPWTTRYNLLKWVDPVFGSNLYNAHESTGVQWGAGHHRRGDRRDRRGHRPRFVDAAEPIARSSSPRSCGGGGSSTPPSTSSSAGPGPAWPSSRPRWSRTASSTGAVNGVGTLVRRTGGVVRKAQSGYVRNYALAIVLGVVGVLAFMLSRLWW